MENSTSQSNSLVSQGQITFLNISIDDLKSLIRECVDDSIARQSEKLQPVQTAKVENMYLYIKDVASEIGYKYDTIYKKHKDGQMPPKVPGKRVKFLAKDIHEWISAGMPSDWEGYLLEKKTKEYLKTS